MSDCSVVTKSWGELTTDELYSFLKLRTDVFYVEQKVDDEELDNRDREESTEHYWISDDAGTAAYLRVLVDSTAEHLDAHRIIGRVVVRRDRRGEGLAQALLRQVISTHGGEAMLLHAQVYAAPLYAKAGFVPFGDAYSEAGIAHQSMYRAGE
ncbi:ElaA protein [Glaciihabitans tibetensis]|uniref:ElaA protein n=1 Tax=Glaciihabitans tibetensis TaxID=1266600 RepID=A0A2T0VAF3_9MICO|nr:GNAT family N-acetyltransferase [Glaciihabitans tibetensis]PRY67170.1 ElaA protein [Glaciihabitans tibetensis]